VPAERLIELFCKPGACEIWHGFSGQLLKGHGYIVAFCVKLPCHFIILGKDNLVERGIFPVLMLKPAHGCPLPCCSHRLEVVERLKEFLAPNIGQRRSV